MVNVSWYGATAYVKWLSGKTGKTYRLPSEAEREYAARGVTSATANHTAYWWGNNFNPSKTNNAGKTVSVGRYGANRFGLYDMHGNVWEWTGDCWNDSYKKMPAKTKQTGAAWTTGDCSRRVVRGGSWVDNPWYLRSAARYGDAADHRGGLDGIRVARTLEP